jgi:hypothetical protein
LGLCGNPRDIWQDMRAGGHLDESTRAYGVWLLFGRLMGMARVRRTHGWLSVGFFGGEGLVNNGLRITTICSPLPVA